MFTKKQFTFFAIIACCYSQSLYPMLHIEDLLEDHTYYREQATVLQKFLTINFVKDAEVVTKYEEDCCSQPLHSTNILEDVCKDIHYYKQQVTILHKIVITNIFKENLKIIQQLFKLGLHIDAIDKYGNTFLHYATLSANVKIVEYLLQKGARIDINNDQFFPASHFIPEKNKLKLTELYLEYQKNN